MATNYRELYWPLVIRENSPESQSLSEVREGTGKTLPCKQLPSCVHCFPHLWDKQVQDVFILAYGLGSRSNMLAVAPGERSNSTHCVSCRDWEMNSGALPSFPPFPHFIGSRVTACESVPPTLRKDRLSSSKPLWKHPHRQVRDSKHATEMILSAARMTLRQIVSSVLKKN